MSVEITTPDLMALAFIANRLRAADAEEIFAGAIANPTMLACETVRAGGLQWIAWDDKTPVASFGGHEAWPGVWSVWMWATDDWPRVALSVTRFILREMIPAIQARGGHRGQCASAATHTTAHAWLQSLGFQAEGRMRGYGRDGQDFIMFGWLKEDAACA